MGLSVRARLLASAAGATTTLSEFSTSDELGRVKPRTGTSTCGKNIEKDFFGMVPEFIPDGVSPQPTPQKLLYEDPARWSFAFNHFSTLTRLQIQTRPAKSPVKMIERSLFSTRYTFVENAREIRWLTDLEFLILNQYFDFIESSFVDAKIDLFVYLRVSPETCLKRIRKRSREEENPISQEYIKTLHLLHEELFVLKNRKLPAPVLVLDGNADLSDMYEIYDKNKLTILGGYT